MKANPRFYAGLDMGSVSIKAVIIANGQMVASGLTPSGGQYKAAAARLMEEVLAKAAVALEDLSGLVVTGLGSQSVPFEAPRISDISCHARGCYTLFPSARTLIDIGGQFTKTARITAQGSIADFLMSEKCATGSGRFLQVISRILRIPLEEIGPLSLQSQNPVEFSTNCAVFAESETVSRIAEGAQPADILAGVHRAMAAKVKMLAKRVKLEADVVLTGGGGEDAGLVQAVGQALGLKILVPENPRLTAAYGAACLAAEPNVNR